MDFNSKASGILRATRLVTTALQALKATAKSMSVADISKIA
jgi:hypothetical protein